MSKKANRIQGKQTKKQRRSSKRWTAEEARAELNAWRKSGLSMAAFSKKRGLQVNRLYNWRRRLKEWVSGDQVGGVMLLGGQKSLRLIEATVGTQTTPALIVRFGDGGSIEVPELERVDAGWLVQLVRGLSEPALR